MRGEGAESGGQRAEGELLPSTSGRGAGGEGAGRRAESKERRAEGELLPSTSGRGAGGEGRGQRAESKERRAESGASDHPAKGAALDYGHAKTSL